MSKENIIVNQETSRLAILQSAILSNDVDAAKMAQLLEVQLAWEANEERKDFAASMSEFQGDVPAVPKTRPIKNKGGQVTHHYASKSDIEKVIKPFLKAHGLSVMLTKSEFEGDRLTISGMIIHKNGHSEPIGGNVKIDSKMFCNDTQKVGSAMSYGWRYIVCPALGIILEDETDDDGEASGEDEKPEYITQDQIDEIETFLGNLNGSDNVRAAIFALTGCESLDKIQSHFFTKIIAKLRVTLEKQES